MLSKEKASQRSAGAAALMLGIFYGQPRPTVKVRDRILVHCVVVG